MDKNHKLIIIRGNSGSGKTTVSKILHKMYTDRSFLISQDEIKKRLISEYKYNATKLRMDVIKRLLDYGYNNYDVVILEGILRSGVNGYTDIFKYALELFGRNIFAYYYDLSFEECLKRHNTKNEKNEFGEDEMNRWWKEKDYIGIIPETTIDDKVSPKDLADNIIRDVDAGPSDEMVKAHEKYFNGLWFLHNDDASYALPLGFDMNKILEECISNSVQ